MFCFKISHITTQDNLLQDGTVFLDYPVTLAMSEVPTKRFTFKCHRLVEDRQSRQDLVVAMMVQRNSGDLHVPPVRARLVMTGKDNLYNDIRKYLQDNEVVFSADLADSVGDEFLKHLTYALFPLSSNHWKSLHDTHNRGGAAPDPEFGVFFGRKILGHKVYNPCLPSVVQHLQDMWFGMGIILKKGNWPVVSLKIKHLLTLIQKYAERTCSQTERQKRLFNTELHARNIENSTHVCIFEPLLIRLVLPPDPLHLNTNILKLVFYVRMEVNNYMEGRVAWQRCVFSILCFWHWAWISDFFLHTYTYMMLLLLLLMILLLVMLMLFL
jgi:hypothetical protein